MDELDLVRRITALEKRLKRLDPQQRRYTLTIHTTQAAQVIPDNTSPFTVVNYGTVEYDPLGIVTNPTTAWLWTAPFAGTVWGHAGLMYATTASWAAGDAGEIDLYLNGAKKTVIDRIDNQPANTFMRLGDSFALRVAAGNTLTIRAYQNSGTVGGLALYSAASGFNRVELLLIG